MICCKNCGTPIGRVSFCPACGVTQDYPVQEDFEPSAHTRPIWETDPLPAIPSEERQTEPESPGIVVVPSRSPSGTKYEMGAAVFGESNAPITNASNPVVPDEISLNSPERELSSGLTGSTEAVFREELRQASSKLPSSNVRANRHARQVQGAGVQRTIAIASLIIGALSFPYGIALVILGWISLRKIQSAIYAGTDEEVAANMRTVRAINIVAICILVVTVIIGLFFVIGVLAEIGALNIG